MRLTPLLLLIPVVVSLEQECYVCRSEDEELSPELKRQFPGESLPVCGREEPLKRACPPRYKGCLTQYNGERVSKSCNEHPLTDCSRANNIKYCFCTGRLCNAQTEAVSESDDEDLTEGSGGGGGTTAATTLLPPPISSTSLRPSVVIAGAQHQPSLSISLALLALLFHLPQ